jgi:hypothetical protein
MSAIDFDSGTPSARISLLRVVDVERRLVSVEWGDGRRAGLVDRVDLSPLIDRFRVFAPLRDDPEMFATAHLIDEGYAVAWGDGVIDVSAESVERLVGEARRNDGFFRALGTRIGAMLGRDAMDRRKRA